MANRIARLDSLHFVDDEGRRTIDNRLWIGCGLSPQTRPAESVWTIEQKESEAHFRLEQI